MRPIVRRMAQLYTGLVLFGFSTALMVRSGLGLAGWDVLHQGLADRTGVSLGHVVIAVGALVLLAWIPLRQRPGLGTVSNVVVVGFAADAALAVLPAPGALTPRVALLATGVTLNGIATGLYVGAGLGPGPRDGLMTGFAARTGFSLRRVRILIEAAVLAAGWALGGSIGPGTVAYALAIGPLAQFFITRFAVPEPDSAAATTDSTSSTSRPSSTDRTDSTGCTGSTDSAAGTERTHPCPAF